MTSAMRYCFNRASVPTRSKLQCKWNDRPGPNGCEHGAAPAARGGHECVVFDCKRRCGQGIGQRRALSAPRRSTTSRPSSKLPRVAWMMVPAAVVEQTVADLSSRFQRDDIIVDGGNSYYIDDIRRAETLQAKGFTTSTQAPSGGVWGLERGFCQMIGRRAASPSSISIRFFPRSRRQVDSARALPAARRSKACTAEHGYLHCGPNGAGHFVKMVHQRNRVRHHGGVCGRDEHSEKRQRRQADSRSRRGNHAAAQSKLYQLRLQSHRRRRGLAARAA